MGMWDPPCALLPCNCAHTGTVKAGYAGDDDPRSVFPTIVGVPNRKMSAIGTDTKDTYIGDEAQCKRAMLALRYPVEHGIVTNWDDMEMIWHHTFYNELRVAPDEHNVLLTEVPLNPHKNREMMAQIMFETFNVRATHVAIQAVLALYACGRTTGLVLDCGDGVSDTVPIYEGYAMKYAIRRSNVAGRDVTQRLLKLLQTESSVTDLSPSAGAKIARSIKEKLCYVAVDPREKAAKSCTDDRKEYELPDGRVVELGESLWSATECLFDPTLVGVEQEGLVHMVKNAVDKCDLDVRKDMYENIVLCGGTTMCPGLPERIAKGVKNLVPDAMKSKVEVVAAPERAYSVWIGGSILSSLSTFETMWVTKAMYEEGGVSVIHQKD